MAKVGEKSGLQRLLDTQEGEILEAWVARLKAEGADGAGRVRDAELTTQCQSFLAYLRRAVSGGVLDDVGGEAFDDTRAALTELSASRANQGFSPTETAMFVFALKQPLFEALQREQSKDPTALVAEILTVSNLLDQLGLFTTDAYQRSREEVILRQHQEIAELSTPVVKLWDGILALPLIGTLDSARTQVVMENLLQSIVDQEAEIAIIDITGVPTVDTLVAQHLLKTIAAARLMGADCVISGIRPQIAQTMVHLGVELSVVSKASLADAFALALQRTGRVVVKKTAQKA